MSTYRGQDTVVEHLAHPLDGSLVLDTSTGRTGVISGQQIKRISWSDQVVQRLVWLAPPGGGYQWSADPDGLVKQAS